MLYEDATELCIYTQIFVSVSSYTSDSMRNGYRDIENVFKFVLITSKESE